MTNIAVANDWTNSHVNLVTHDDAGDQVHHDLTAREARKIAQSLLKAADDAEDQRVENLKKAKALMSAGNVDQAAWLVEANGFTDDELNQGA